MFELKKSLDISDKECIIALCSKQTKELKVSTPDNISNEELIDVLKTICVTDGAGSKCWYLNGQRHRVDGPAIEYADGSKCWYLNNQLHRVDGPAIEYADGAKKWFLNGILHHRGRI